MKQTPLRIEDSRAISPTFDCSGIIQASAPEDPMTGRRHIPEKHVGGTPTGITPSQPSKRRPRSLGQASSRRKLTYGAGNEVEVPPVVTSSLTSSKPKLEKAVLIASSADG